MSPPAASPYLFVTGAARSGTTLLQRMLDAHPELAVVNETYWVPRKFRERNGLTRAGTVTPALAPLLLANPRFERMGFTHEDVLALIGEQPSYAEFVARLFTCYAQARGKRYAGDKTPGYVRRIPELHELLPATRFVHIIRDPRDVTVSMLDWSSGERTAGQFGTWQDDPAVSTALYWHLSVALGREHGQALGSELYHEVRYEDLVSSPADALARICAFLKLPFDERMVTYHEGKTRIKAGRSSKAQWLPVTPGLRDWKTQLSADQVRGVEAATGDLLEQAGYARQYDTIDASIRARVARLHERFTATAVADGRTLPRGWAT